MVKISVFTKETIKYMTTLATTIAALCMLKLFIAYAALTLELFPNLTRFLE